MPARAIMTPPLTCLRSVLANQTEPPAITRAGRDPIAVGGDRGQLLRVFRRSSVPGGNLFLSRGIGSSGRRRDAELQLRKLLRWPCARRRKRTSRATSVHPTAVQYLGEQLRIKSRCRSVVLGRRLAWPRDLQSRASGYLRSPGHHVSADCPAVSTCLGPNNAL